MSGSEVTFPPEVIAAVCRHMNDDHVEDSLLIVRALADRPGATSATMTGLDGEAAVFSALVDGVPEAVRIPWAGPVTERAQIRAEVVRMYHDACAALGIEPRPAEQH